MEMALTIFACLQEASLLSEPRMVMHESCERCVSVARPLGIPEGSGDSRAAQIPSTRLAHPSSSCYEQWLKTTPFSGELSLAEESYLAWEVRPTPFPTGSSQPPATGQLGQPTKARICRLEQS